VEPDEAEEEAVVKQSSAVTCEVISVTPINTRNDHNPLKCRPNFCIELQ
jgi:hypothetical protein